MGNDRSPWNQHNVWRHHNLQCSKSGNSELETVTSDQELIQKHKILC